LRFDDILGTEIGEEIETSCQFHGKGDTLITVHTDNLI